MAEDFYELLEVSPDASQAEIKEAFREQVREYHPDLNDDDRAQAQFTVLKKAYDILGDPVERRAYDRLGHQSYVAKRTSGLPSPDLWADADSTDESPTQGSQKTRSRGRSASSSKQRSSSSRSSSRSESKSSTSSSRSRSKSTGSSQSRSGTNSSWRNRSRTRRSRTTDGGGSGTTHRQSSAAEQGATESSLLRWWRRQNIAWPLLWTATLWYLAGIIQFGATYTAELSALWTELRSVGADPSGLWATLTTSQHGLESMAVFSTTAAPIAQPTALETVQWYGLLGGLVVLAVAGILTARLAWRTDTWGRVSTDELVVLTAAIAISGTAFGGPSLAGIILLPLLFGVIVHRTRQGRGWAPSPLWVGLVCAPAIGLALSLGGVSSFSLATDLAVFVILPLAGSIGLLCRVSIRKRLGR